MKIINKASVFTAALMLAVSCSGAATASDKINRSQEQVPSAGVDGQIKDTVVSTRTEHVPAGGGAAAAGGSYEKEFLSSAPVQEFTRAEQNTLQKLDQWQNDPQRSKQSSTVNGDGTVVFVYGAQDAEILCSVLNLTDIEFEPGEQISSVNLGDPSRWTVSAAVTGSGENTAQHVIVKPVDSGLKTTMMVATDRRGYRLRLKSTLSKFYPHVAFTYPDEINRQFKAQAEAAAAKRERESIKTDPDSGTKTYLGDLNFNYKVEGDVSWKPVRVYDDGKKTIIEMPETMTARAAPSLLLLLDKGGLFSDEVTELINYRVDGTRYIVDGLFETAILTMDLDSRQQRVVITRMGGRL